MNSPLHCQRLLKALLVPVALLALVGCAAPPERSAVAGDADTGWFGEPRPAEPGAVESVQDPVVGTSPSGAADPRAREPLVEPNAFSQSPYRSRPRNGRGRRPVGSTAVQALIGASNYSGLRTERTVPGDDEDILVADVSQLPSIGLAGQYKFGGGDAVEYGMDGGLIYSWAGDREAVYLGNGSTLVFVEQRLSLTDLFAGAYVSADLAGKARVYGAGGGTLLWGYSSYEDELRDDSNDAFGAGGYLRGGVELRMHTGALLGIGGRWQWNDLDFGGQVGTYDVDGWQVFLTYTVGL